MAEVEVNVFDEEEVHHNCKVTIWKNRVTGERSTGWEYEPAGYRCFNCGATLIWGNDFSFEDYGMEGSGIVSEYTCPECDAIHDIWVPVDDGDGDS